MGEEKHNGKQKITRKKHGTDPQPNYPEPFSHSYDVHGSYSEASDHKKPSKGLGTLTHRLGGVARMRSGNRFGVVASPPLPPRLGGLMVVLCALTNDRQPSVTPYLYLDFNPSQRCKATSLRLLIYFIVISHISSTRLLPDRVGLTSFLTFYMLCLWL